MKLTSKIVKKAWEIRKSVAVELNCKVSLVSWKICLEMAVETPVSEEVCLSAFGKVWEKNAVKRIYNPDWRALVDFAGYSVKTGASKADFLYENIISGNKLYKISESFIDVSSVKSADDLKKVVVSLVKKLY